MLTTIRDDMIEALKDLGLFKTVDVWKGELPDLKMQARSLPSAYVALSFGEYAKIKTMPPRDARLVMQWDVYLFMGGLSASQTVTTAGYELIEAVSAKSSDGGLTGMVTAAGLLWPADLELAAADNGVIVYRLGFGIECQVPAYVPPAPE